MQPPRRGCAKSKSAASGSDADGHRQTVAFLASARLWSSLRMASSRDLLSDSQAKPREFSIGAVVFDLDGTLIDSRGDIAAAVNHSLLSSGRRALPASMIATFVGDGARTLLARASRLSEADAELDSLLEAFLDYYADDPRQNHRTRSAYLSVHQQRSACYRRHPCKARRKDAISSDLCGRRRSREEAVGEPTAGVGSEVGRRSGVVGDGR